MFLVVVSHELGDFKGLIDQRTEKEDDKRLGTIGHFGVSLSNTHWRCMYVCMVKPKIF